jgi:hypothetical protein
MPVPKTEAKPIVQLPVTKIELLLAAMRQQQQMYGRK